MSEGKFKFTREEKSWMMYDWANSAHSIVVVTILPIFFMSLFEDNTSAVATWGSVTSASKFIVALLAPLMGTLGDFKDMKKRLLALFLTIGVMACLGLSGMPFSPKWQLILGLYALSNIGFAGANIFYDGFLPEVTTHERMDRVSAWGFGLGYIGGSTIPFIIFLVLFMTISANMAMAISFALTGVWWGVFSLPLLKNVKQIHYVERKKGMVLDSLRQLSTTVKDIYHNKTMLFFLLAYFFYIDGVNTIIYMSTAYGSALHIDGTQMMLALLMVQILAFPFALLYGHLAGKFGTSRMIWVGILIYTGICVFGFFVRETWHFWVLAALVATSQGGVQALSRSLFGKMIPNRERSNEFFGFFEIFGKFSAIMGPWLFGFSTLKAAEFIRSRQPEISQMELDRSAAPFGVFSVLIIFVFGAIFFALYNKQSKRHVNN
ncbi:MAG: MFS transporter [Spirochaetales bacterium]|nr:MFS transporter [Spirochaetales bacterium]